MTAVKWTRVVQSRLEGTFLTIEKEREHYILYDDQDNLVIARPKSLHIAKRLAVKYARERNWLN